MGPYGAATALEDCPLQACCALLLSLRPPFTTVVKGWSTPLQQDDLPEPPTFLRAEPTLHREAHANWVKELAAGRKGGPSLMRAVWFPAARRSIIQGCTFGAVSGLANTVGRPLMLRYALLAMDPDGGYTEAEGFGFAAGLVFMMWLEGFTKTQSISRVGGETSTLITSATVHLLGLKALSIKTGEGKSGAETALVGNDLMRLNHFLQVWSRHGPRWHARARIDGPAAHSRS